jgi:serine/threonine protein kinase
VLGRPIDLRSDVFALGIVLYEIATARRLFKGENDFLTMSAIVHGEIPLPSEHRPDLPRALEEIIMTALATDPGDRFQSADELRGELDAFMQSLGMRISPSSIADYMKKLFGSRIEPWLVPDDPSFTTTTLDFDGSPTGVATVSGEAMPSVKASASSPLVFARSGWTGRPATVPADGWLEATPLGWSPEPPRHPRRKRLGIALGAAALAVVAAVTATVVARSDASSGQPAMTATPAPPPGTGEPPPPPPSTDPPPTAPAAAPREPAPSEPPPAEPPPQPDLAAAPPDEPAATPPRADPPPRQRPARRTVKKSRPTPKTWDPDALFPK